MGRSLPFLLLVLIATMLGGVIALFYFDRKDWADLLVRIISSFGVFFAVLVALYGEWFKRRVKLTVKEVKQSDSFTNMHEGKRVLCHHLRVVNETPYRPVENCRVWLIRILDQHGLEFNEDFKFAVPRLMQWAPFEYSPDRRTFTEDQVFDLGQTQLDFGRFEPSIYEDQGGMFKGACEAGKTRRYVFKITADNYISRRTFVVDVSCRKVDPTTNDLHGVALTEVRIVL